jgi:5-formyltetrahydrofolate cyclo-ligase
MDSFLVANAKSALRRDLNLARSARAKNEKNLLEQNQRLQNEMTSLCSSLGVKRVAAYLSFGSEPSTRDFLDWALQQNVQVMLPVVKPDNQLEWVTYDGTTTRDSVFGFEEAVGTEANLVDAEIIFVPALAIDHLGHRLGKGKGFYDRALAHLPGKAKRVAVIFDEELLPEVPAESHDLAVNAVITPSGFKWLLG